MGIEWNEVSSKSFGGTEQMARRLEADLPKDLLDNFQIILSRVRELDETKVRILWLHDLPPDPESHHLRNGGWRKFHRLVFVSYWQREWYCREYQIPPSRTAVIHNAIEPIQTAKKPDPEDGVRLIYSTTPHRGLELLAPVFDRIAETDKKVHLDVYSSFEIYGWGERDKQYEDLFKFIKSHPQITYHGYQPNEKVREALTQAHIMAYPNIWMETSCLSLMEGMSAECYCVHPDLGALTETAANWTYMYAFHEDKNQHAGVFHGMLETAIGMVRSKDEGAVMKAAGAKSYCDLFYNWEIRKSQWQHFLEGLVNLPRQIEQEQALFVYRA
jgi:UDP-glucose:(glucosyl)LPS alpha-1,2-glucosyltransferase